MEAIIAEANARNCEAWNTRDFEKMKELYTEDFQTMPAGAPMVKGIQACIDYWKKGANDDLHTMHLKTEEIVGPMTQGETQTAIERGICTFNKKSGEEFCVCKYIVCWRKDGENWKPFMDIYNFDKEM